MQYYHNENRYQGGTAMLLIVIVLTASALIAATSLSFLSLGELDMGYTYQCGEEAFSLADGCMEEAFRRIKLDSNYSGGNLDLSGGNCIIEISGDLVDKNINTVGNAGFCNKEIDASITISGGEIIINSWQEVEN